MPNDQRCPVFLLIHEDVCDRFSHLGHVECHVDQTSCVFEPSV